MFAVEKIDTLSIYTVLMLVIGIACVQEMSLQTWPYPTDLLSGLTATSAAVSSNIVLAALLGVFSERQ